MNFVSKVGQQQGIPARPSMPVEGGSVRSLGGSLLHAVGGGRGTGISREREMREMKGENEGRTFGGWRGTRQPTLAGMACL